MIAMPISTATQIRLTEFGVNSTATSPLDLIASRIDFGMSSPPSISRSSRNVYGPNPSILAHSDCASLLSAVA
jgi:hypothetical protein